jgi:hypothetical protein
MRLFFVGEGGDERTITTTVGDLVSKLQTMDQGALVFTEGCDCIGNVVGVETESDGTVLILRDDATAGYMDITGILPLAKKYQGRVEDRLPESVHPVSDAPTTAKEAIDLLDATVKAAVLAGLAGQWQQQADSDTVAVSEETRGAVRACAEALLRLCTVA